MLPPKKRRFKEYSLEVRAELPQTKVADRQPSPRAGRPEGIHMTLGQDQ